MENMGPLAADDETTMLNKSKEKAEKAMAKTKNKKTLEGMVEKSDTFEMITNDPKATIQEIGEIIKCAESEKTSTAPETHSETQAEIKTPLEHVAEATTIPEQRQE